MKDIKKLVENIVQDRNEIIARLAYVQGVDLTNSDYSSFKPNEAVQEKAMSEITELAMYFEDEYKSFRLPELFQYCNEKYKFNEHWSGVWKEDALKLLGLESCSDIDLLFSGLFSGLVR